MCNDLPTIYFIYLKKNGTQRGCRVFRYEAIRSVPRYWLHSGPSVKGPPWRGLFLLLLLLLLFRQTAAKLLAGRLCADRGQR